MKYATGLWNYYNTGEYDPEVMAKDFADLGFNLVMSCEYDPEKHDKAEFLRHLDLLSERNMKVIVCDARVRWTRLTERGEEEFIKGMNAAAADFAAHPAVYGFHVGDEPGAKQMPDMIKAYKLVKAAAPHLHPFVNFLPIWKEPNFKEWLGVEPEKYGELLDKIVKEAGIEMLCYDYYGQCAYFDRDEYTELYFENLRVFGEVARKNGIPFFTTLLSVGHWSLRPPTEDDIRWQISTATAAGVTGILWFFVYERNRPDGSFRVPPIDLFNERTETFGWLSRENRTFMKFFAPALEDYDYVKTYAVGREYGGFPVFKPGDEGIDKIEFIITPEAPTLLAVFAGKKGKRFMLVNGHRELPVKIKVSRENDGFTDWLAPGQLKIFD